MGSLYLENVQPLPPKKRGRKAGVKTGPRIGSRPWQLINMKAGDQLFLKAPNGVSRLMMQIQADISRNGLTKQFTMRRIIGVAPCESEVVHIVEVTRFADGQLVNLKG